MRKMCILVAILALAFAGCYHATIETGKYPSGQVIKKSFASSWVYGLVPPSTVEAAAECPNGVARVETQLSFVNQLVGFLTLGIYTPMEITVTCAEGSGASLDQVPLDIELASDASQEDIRAAFSEAARQSVSQGRAVYVRFGACDEQPTEG